MPLRYGNRDNRQQLVYELMKRILYILIGVMLFWVTPVNARWWAIQGSSGVGAAVSYSNWTENAESTLDGVSLVCMMENVADSGNETALSPNGAVSGVSLTLTANGDPGGMSGGTRYFDGDDGLIFDEGAIPAALMSGTSSWTVILKIKTYPTLDNDGKYFISDDPGGADRLYPGHNASAKLRLVVDDQDGASDVSTANDMLADTEYYVVTVNDNTNGVCWIGFIVAGTGSGAVGQPTKGSDFTSGNTVAAVGTFGNYLQNMDHDARKLFHTIQAYLEYIILDNTALVDSVL